MCPVELLEGFYYNTPVVMTMDPLVCPLTPNWKNCAPGEEMRHSMQSLNIQVFGETQGPGPEEAPETNKDGGQTASVDFLHMYNSPDAGVIPIVSISDALRKCWRSKTSTVNPASCSRSK